MLDRHLQGTGPGGRRRGWSDAWWLISAVAAGLAGGVTEIRAEAPFGATAEAAVESPSPSIDAELLSLLDPDAPEPLLEATLPALPSVTPTVPGAVPLSHYVTYDDGWCVRPFDPTESPFELRLNFHNQFRYTLFSPSETTSEIGNDAAVRTRNDFALNRGRLVFSGYALDPNLEFYTNVDVNTVAPDPVLLLLSWISYRFGDALKLHAGLGKVPGTWEWQETSRYTLGAERTMATTFFRPSITAGVWANGQVGEGLFYEAMVGDGFNTFTLRSAELDPNLAYAIMSWWEPLAPFGDGFSDLEFHPSLALRVGHAYTWTTNDNDPSGEPGPEQTVIRLSNGRRLVAPDALAPGATVNRFDLDLYAVHCGAKYRGSSLAAEYFFRWLSDLSGTGNLPVTSLFDHGMYVQGGTFVVPRRVELYGAASFVTGEFGSGSEFSGGVNWYWKGRRGTRFTTELTRLEDSPTEQDRTGLVAGASGLLLRSQFWIFF